MSQLQAASAPFLSLPFLGMQPASGGLGSGVAPSKKNLEHYWKWDDDPATQVIIDEIQPSSIAWNVFGTAVTSVAGIQGNALQDSNMLATISNPDNQHVMAHVDNRDFSFSMWVKPDDLSSDKVVFQVIQDAISNPFPGNNECEIVYDHTANRYKFTLVTDTATSTTSTTVTANTFGAPSTGTWTLIVVWVDKANGQVGIACNGLEDTASYTGPIHFVLPSNDPHNPFHAVFWGNWNGAFDETGWWSRLLSDQERLGLYNNGLGRAYSTFTTDTNAWTEFGHGGMLGDGHAVINSDATASGGQVANSSAPLKAIYTIGTTGGTVCDGSASVSVVYPNINAAGGVVVSGSYSTTNVYNEHGSGGCVANGTATNTEICFQIATGGAVCGGLVLFPEAGLLCAGSAIVHSIVRPTTSGGVVVAGLVPPFEWYGTGGLVCSNSADFRVGYIDTTPAPSFDNGYRFRKKVRIPAGSLPT